MFIEKLRDWPKPDLILYGGDGIARFRPGERNLFEEIAALSKYGLCAVAGNDDKVPNRIAGKRVYDVHTTALDLGRFAVVGIEGASVVPARSRRKAQQGLFSLSGIVHPTPNTNLATGNPEEADHRFTCATLRGVGFSRAVTGSGKSGTGRSVPFWSRARTLCCACAGTSIIAAGNKRGWESLNRRELCFP